MKKGKKKVEDIKLLKLHKECPFYEKTRGIECDDSGHQLTWKPTPVEDLVKTGKEDKTCIYYSMKARQSRADVVLMPYNYLIS